MGTFTYIVFVIACFSIVVAAALWSMQREKQVRIDNALHERALRKERSE